MTGKLHVIAVIAVNHQLGGIAQQVLGAQFEQIVAPVVQIQFAVPRDARHVQHFVVQLQGITLYVVARCIYGFLGNAVTPIAAAADQCRHTADDQGTTAGQQHRAHGRSLDFPVAVGSRRGFCDFVGTQMLYRQCFLRRRGLCR